MSKKKAAENTALENIQEENQAENQETENQAEIQPENQAQETAAEAPKEEKRVWPEQLTILADGTELVAACGYDGERTVWIWMEAEEVKKTGMDIMQAVMICSNPDKMREIHQVIHGRETDKWEGFTKLKSIGQVTSGRISIAMEKEG